MTTTGTQARCTATNRTGQPCGSWASGASGYCFLHDPARAGDVAAARRKGGAARHGRTVGPVVPSEHVTLATMADVLALLGRCVNDALLLENSLNRVRALTAVCGTWAKCYEVSEIERRLAALEERLNHDQH